MVGELYAFLPEYFGLKPFAVKGFKIKAPAPAALRIPEFLPKYWESPNMLGAKKSENFEKIAPNCTASDNG